MDLGDKRRLNEVNSEVAGLERGRSLIAGDQLHVPIKTSQKIMEHCKFSIADHRLGLSCPRHKDTIKLRPADKRIFKIPCLRNMIGCLE